MGMAVMLSLIHIFRASGGFPGSMGTVSIDNGAIELGDFTKVHDMTAEETPAQCAITDEENALFYPWYTQYSWDNSCLLYTSRRCSSS